MKRNLGILFVFALLVQGAYAEEPAKKKWYEEGFVKNALQGRAAAMLDDSGFSREEVNWYRCGAISQAQFKHAELYVSPTEETPCYEDKDCGIGSLGGFCATAAHKTQLAAYEIYVKSPTYVYLQKNWRAGRCHGPVGLCLPVDTAYCEKKDEQSAGVCRGKWAEKPSDEPVFFQPLNAEEKK